MTTGSIASILARSAPLEERLAAPDPGQNFAEITALLDRWRGVFDSGTHRLFDARLASIGLSIEQARLRLGVLGRGPDRESKWFDTFLEGFSYPAYPAFVALKLPFAPLWAPLASFAHDLVFRDAKARRLTSEQASRNLSQALLEDLCRIAAEAVYLLFEEQREKGQSFNEFVRLSLRSDGELIFDRFPALARCLGVVFQNWISSTQLFTRRLAADWAELHLFFPELKSDGPIQSISTGFSDRHDKGLQVLLLEFSGGSRVLYKPKDMSLEARLPQINQWLGAEGFPFKLKFPTSLEKEGYGWSSFIRQEPCNSIEEVKTFFEHAGALLCLAHTLNGKDLLLENIIASGCDPVPIDLETFFQPQAQRADRIGSPPDRDPPEYLRRSSVLETGMLPYWHIAGLDIPCDLSGLSGSKENLPEIRQPYWDAVNTDDMKRSDRGYKSLKKANRPSYHGAFQHPRDYEGALIDGFCQLYRFLCARKKSFIDFLQTFSNTRTRLIFRSTQMYGLLSKQSLRAENLTDGILRSSIFETIYRPALKGSYLSTFLKAILDQEVRCLECLDVPRFYVRLDSDVLTIDHGLEIPHFLLESPLETVRQRVLAMSSETEGYHVENLQESLRRRPRTIGPSQTHGEIVEIAGNLVGQVLSRSRNDPAKNLWPLPTFTKQPLPEHECDGLYLGDIGVAIFLAAWDFTQGTAISKRPLDTLFSRLQGRRLPQNIPLGICNGLGSYAYGCLVLAKLTEQDRWLELSNRFGEEISVERLASEPDPDIVYGLAGAIVSLVRLYQSTGDRSFLERAQSGMEALAPRFIPETGWARPNGEALLGFAHGSAGIAFAALMLAEASKEERFSALARDAFALDRRFYSESEKNWAPSTQRGGSALQAWCSGSPGITLARLTAWRLTQDPVLAAEIERTWQSFPELLGLDHWCCGNLGLVELLWHASQKLGREDLRSKADALLGKTVQRALRSAFFRFNSELGHNFCFQPSLFRGTAGLGYTLLRFLHPDRLPCILAFEV
jgi:type 2 lantibiotic biosynthesis protein LanM